MANSDAVKLLQSLMGLVSELEDMFRPSGLSFSQFFVLVRLDEHCKRAETNPKQEKPNLTALAAYPEVPKPSGLSNLLKGMTKARLVKRIKEGKDVKFTLTPAGQVVLKKGIDLIHSKFEKTFGETGEIFIKNLAAQIAEASSIFTNGYIKKAENQMIIGGPGSGTL